MPRKDKEKNRLYQIKYRAEYPEKITQQKRRHYQKHKERLCLEKKYELAGFKERIFSHYGQKCVCCGETQKEFLTVDHINGDGAEHRRKVGSGTNFFRWLVKNNFPPGFRILCCNCNYSLGRYGYCPHGNVKVEKRRR